MKNWLFFSLLLVLFGSMVALESDPSEVVGYVKIEAGIGYTSYAHPFSYYDATHTETLALDDIIGTQLTAGNILTADRIVQISNGAYGYLNSTSNLWSGGLATAGFADNEAYYFKVHASHTEQDVYLAGSVVLEAQTVGACGVGYNWVAIRDARVVDRSELDLLSSGFVGGNILTSDRLVDPVTGNYAYYNTVTSSWAGTLQNIVPGNAYQVKVHSSHTGFTWTYDPTGADDLIPTRYSGMSENNFTPAIDKKLRK